MSGDAFSGARGQPKSVGFIETASLLQDGPSIDENDVISLAQRYYLSPEVVREAKVVFDHYCSLELKLQLERVRRMMLSRSSRKSGAPMDPSLLEESKVGTATSDSHDARNTENEVIAAEKVSQTSGSNEDSPANRNHASRLTLDNNLVLHDAETSSATPQPPEQKQQQYEDEKNEVRLGVEGLQQFFLDLGTAISSLEVADLVHTLNDDPIDFVMRQRSIEAAASQAASEATQTNATTGKRRMSPSRTGPNKKKGKVGDEETASNALFDAHGKNLGVSPMREKSLRDGVSFSHFLFILSNVLLEEEDNQTAKDAEVEELFNLLDVDKDGAISLKDVHATVERLVSEGVLSSDTDIVRLRNMTSVELDTALMECDVNDDGRVTVEDLCNVLHP